MSLAGITDVLKRPRVASTTQTLERPDTQASISSPTKGREGKRSDPDYERINIYIRSDTRIAARRKAENANGGRKVDESDLIQRLLADYVSS